MEDYIRFLIPEKFVEEFDNRGETIYRLKEKLSEEGWKKVRDLFYYDPNNNVWLTKKPEEVIKRLENDEWKTDVQVFKTIAESLKYSMDNAKLLYEAYRTVKRYEKSKVLDLLRKAIKFPAGNTVKFSDGVKILEHHEDWENNLETFLVEKNGEKYFVVLQWMTSIDDAGYVGAVWKYEDVKDVPLEDLMKAVDLYIASSLIYTPTSETLKEGKILVNGQEFKYKIQKVTLNNPLLQLNEEWYNALVWAGGKYKPKLKLKTLKEAIEYTNAQLEAFKKAFQGEKNKKRCMAENWI